MAHFKRKGPKSTRAGCLSCKPHKAQYLKDTNGARTRQEIQADDREESFADDSFDALDDEG